MVLVIHLSEPAALRKREVEHVFDCGRVAFQNRAFRFTISVLYDVGAFTKFRLKIADTRRNRFDMRQFFHRFGVFKGQFPAITDLFRRAAKGEWLKMERKNNIGSNALYKIIDVVVESADDRRNGNHHGHTDNDAEYRQR